MDRGFPDWWIALAIGASLIFAFSNSCGERKESEYYLNRDSKYDSCVRVMQLRNPEFFRIDTLRSYDPLAEYMFELQEWADTVGNTLTAGRIDQVIRLEKGYRVEIDGFYPAIFQVDSIPFDLSNNSKHLFVINVKSASEGFTLNGELVDWMEIDL